MRYQILEKAPLKKGKYELISLRRQDIFAIKDWRNEQIDVLRQKRPITDDEQEAYFKKVVYPAYNLRHPDNILLSYLYEDKCIGYGGLVNISWNDMRAEISFLMNPAEAKKDAFYKKSFSTYLELIKECAFDVLKLERVYTETFDIRPLHVKTLEENNFELEGRLREHVRIKGKAVDSLIHGCISESR